MDLPLKATIHLPGIVVGFADDGGHQGGSEEQLENHQDRGREGDCWSNSLVECGDVNVL